MSWDWLVCVFLGFFWVSIGTCFSVRLEGLEQRCRKRTGTMDTEGKTCAEIIKSVNAWKEIMTGVEETRTQKKHHGQETQNGGVIWPQKYQIQMKSKNEMRCEKEEEHNSRTDAKDSETSLCLRWMDLIVFSHTGECEMTLIQMTWGGEG